MISSDFHIQLHPSNYCVDNICCQAFITLLFASSHKLTFHTKMGTCTFGGIGGALVKVVVGGPRPSYKATKTKDKNEYKAELRKKRYTHKLKTVIANKII